MSYYFTELEFKDIDDSAFTIPQLILLREPTPEDQIEYKTDNGHKYKTVKGSYVKKRMSLIFGFNYDFQIKSREYFPSLNEVLVEGRLTIRSGSFTIIREQFGKHSLSMENTSKSSSISNHPINIGNAFKSAATDSFKKCASEIGVCWDIYSQESPEPLSDPKATPEQHNQESITKRLEHFLSLQKDLKGIDDVVLQFFENEKTSAERELLIKLYKSKITLKNKQISEGIVKAD